MSAFQNAIGFFVNLGVYDVVLPFLVVFTLMFAMLEKTKILGVEQHGDKKGQTKKNLNAMMAFVIGFLVIASTELVRIINTVLADTVLLVLLSVLFMLLAGSIMATGEFTLKDTGWDKFLLVFFFAAIILIFLNAMGWLEALWRYLVGHIDGPVVGSFLLLGVVVGAMFWLVSDSSGGKEKKAEG